MLMENDKIKKIYFIGIGGISMSGLALICKNRGYEVLGSDSCKTETTDMLIKNGIHVNFSQTANNIKKDFDIVVFSAAIHEDNEEYMMAKNLGLSMMSRATFLGLLMKEYKIRINISGTHGKTTTTAMISQVLIDNNIDPTVLIGGMFKTINGNIRIGSKNIIVTEACEYKNSFLEFFPNAIVITNIEEDHLDFFKDINDIRSSFKKFIEKMPDDGILVINNNIDNINELIKNFNGLCITYGLNSDADYYAKNIELNDTGNYSFDLYNKNKNLGNVTLNILGYHNVENSVAVFSLLLNLGFDFNSIKNSIKKFCGTERRLEYKGTFKNIKIYDDYAHHPSEITASINAFKNLINKNKLVVVFQPHTYTRTNALYEEFAKSFSVLDDLIIIDIYAARETNESGVNSKNLVDYINKKYNKNFKYIENMDTTVAYLIDYLKPNDIVVSMGAGDVFKITNKLIDILKKQ